MHQHETINYIELPSKNLAVSQAFFSTVFGWSFVDYGAHYTAFSRTESGIDGGFTYTEHNQCGQPGSALVVFYSANLPSTQTKIEQAGGTITQAIFEFPGGRRLHFADPNGNEYAVWSDA